MVGIATYLRVMIDESLMQSVVDSHKLDARFFVVEDSFQSVGLLDLICQDIDLIALADALLEVVDQQFEVLVEGRLGQGIKWQYLVVTILLCCSNQSSMSRHDAVFLHRSGESLKI